MRFYLRLAAILFCVLFGLCLLAPAARAFHVYSPFFKTTSRVIDNAGVLTVKWRTKLSELAEDTDYFTGRTVIILTVPSLDGVKPEYYAVTAGEQFGIGAASKPGVLLLLARKERRIQITIGAGLENILTPSVINSIMKERVNPRLEQNDAGGALEAAATAVFEALQGRYASHAQMLREYMPAIIIFPLAVIFFVFFTGSRGQGINIFGGGAAGRW
ncbi:MAG: TPM domain-containing protein [Micavibrio sp.]|nr:TPM domain-containing protein [Micavibrio sp.]